MQNEITKVNPDCKGFGGRFVKQGPQLPISEDPNQFFGIIPRVC